jgi:hypothetical protein
VARAERFDSNDRWGEFRLTDSTADFLFYLYGIVGVDAPEPPEDLAGLEGRPVRLLREGRIAAPVSEVPRKDYSDEALDARLGDLAWVGERGLAHEQVLDWFAERGPVVPLSLFSLHGDEERVRSRLAAESERVLPLLESLRGRREWQVKLWRRDSVVAEHLDELSPTLRALGAEIEQAPPGKRYLLLKKRDAARTEELRRVSERVGQVLFEALREESDHGVVIPAPRGAPQTGHVLVLDSAWLVSEEAYPAFQRRLGELAGEFQPNGFEFEFTGPWPPYHFTDPDAA